MPDVCGAGNFVSSSSAYRASGCVDSAAAAAVPRKPRRERRCSHRSTGRVWCHGMAGARRQDLLNRLAGLSEDAIQRLAEVPGADRAVTAMNSLRERTDELQRRVRGLEGLEQRIEVLEREVEKLSKSSA